MLTATITAALIYFMVQSSGALALSRACWDEHLSRAGKNSSCVGKFDRPLSCPVIIISLCIHILHSNNNLDVQSPHCT